MGSELMSPIRMNPESPAHGLARAQLSFASEKDARSEMFVSYSRYARAVPFRIAAQNVPLNENILSRPRNEKETMLTLPFLPLGLMVLRQV